MGLLKPISENEVIRRKAFLSEFISKIEIGSKWQFISGSPTLMVKHKRGRFVICEWIDNHNIRWEDKFNIFDLTPITTTTENV